MRCGRRFSSPAPYFYLKNRLLVPDQTLQLTGGPRNNLPVPEKLTADMVLEKSKAADQVPLIPHLSEGFLRVAEVRQEHFMRVTLAD